MPPSLTAGQNPRIFALEGRGVGQTLTTSRVGFRYGIALLVISVAIALRVTLDPYLGGSAFIISLTGILLASWLGGLGPSLLCQTLLLLAVAYWLPSHRVPSALSLQGAVHLFAFYSVGSTVAVLSELWHTAKANARQQFSEAVSQREQLLTTLSCITDGVMVTDLEGRVTLMNPVAEYLTGWSLDEIRGKPLQEVVAATDEPTQHSLAHTVQSVLRENQSHRETSQMLLTARSDRQLLVSYSAAPIRNAHGDSSGVVLVFHDESERLRTERALRNADRQKDEFLATLAHELRNPLAPISMGLELMKLSVDDPEETEDIRAMMQRQTQHMVRLIDDLLDVSRITRGKLELRKAKVLLADVMQNAVDAARPALDASEHHFESRLPDHPVYLYADANRLTQVLSNLLNNAAKYTPPGGRIQLSAEVLQQEVVQLSVSDNGQGIDPDKIGHIFEAFTQVRGAMQDGHQGLGIGLCLVKQLVEMHGGDVTASSGGIGQGSQFSVRLPVILPEIEPAITPTIGPVNQPAFRSNLPPAATSPAIGSSTPRESNKGQQFLPAMNRIKRRVLVVDDNSEVLDSLSKLVRCMGNEVYQASDGLQAVEAAERLRPELILMDIGMPNLNGLEACRKIREQSWGKDLLLVAVTGWGSNESQRSTREVGFDRHLVKPVTQAQLQEILDETDLWLKVDQTDSTQLSHPNDETLSKDRVPTDGPPKSAPSTKTCGKAL